MLVVSLRTPGRACNHRLQAGFIVAWAAMMSFVSRVSALTYTVDSVADTNQTACTSAAGDCTLRGAINAANATAGVADVIEFSISSGLQIIVSSGLPPIQDALTIDGRSQPGFPVTAPFHPVIQLSGTGSELRFQAPGAAYGLAIPDDTTALSADAAATSLIVQGCYFGIEADGTTFGTSGDLEVDLQGSTNVLIGGPSVRDRNIIVNGGRWELRVLSGLNVVVEGNYIGTNYTGTVASVRVGAGVQLGGGGVSNVMIRGNVIAGNDLGIAYSGSAVSDVTVLGNWIGLAATGTTLANLRGGIGVVGAATISQLTVGDGTAAGRNVMSGNSGTAVVIRGGSGHSVRGNYVGVGADGNSAAGNVGYGIDVSSASNVSVVDNTISGNVGGVRVAATAGIVLRNNIIGLGADGVTALGNVGNGVGIAVSSSGVSVLGNTISSNTFAGMQINADTVGPVMILGNRIGTTLNGVLGRPNIRAGILLYGSRCQIGDGTIAGRNIISGNAGHGIEMNGGTGHDVNGNFIGVDVTGNAALGNGQQGILTGAGLNASTFRNNVISGNGAGAHYQLSDGGSMVWQGNVIGFGVDRTTLLGNGGPWFSDADAYVLFGGLGDGEGNLVGNNAGSGIFLRSWAAVNGPSVAIRGNSFVGNSGLGIDFSRTFQGPSDGVNQNDDSDADTGPNGLLNFPVLTAAWTSAGNLILRGFAPAASQIDCYADAGDPSNFGEGQYYLGTWVEGSAGDDDARRGAYSLAGIGHESDAAIFAFSSPLVPFHS